MKSDILGNHKSWNPSWTSIIYAISHKLCFLSLAGLWFVIGRHTMWLNNPSNLPNQAAAGGFMGVRFARIMRCGRQTRTRRSSQLAFDLEKDFTLMSSRWATKKPGFPHFPWNFPGCLIGILVSWFMITPFPNRVGFHPLYTVNSQSFFSLLRWCFSSPFFSRSFWIQQVSS